MAAWGQPAARAAVKWPVAVILSQFRVPVGDVWPSLGDVLRQRGVVYDVGRAMGALSVNWRSDYSPALMRRELDIIQADLHANAVRLGGRDPRRVLAAAEYAASLGLDVWLGPRAVERDAEANASLHH